MTLKRVKSIVIVILCILRFQGTSLRSVRAGEIESKSISNNTPPTIKVRQEEARIQPIPRDGSEKEKEVEVCQKPTGED